MRSLQLHICKIFLVLLATGLIAHGQTLEENYNNGSINQREDDCWRFSNFEINNLNPINTSGSEKKHGSTVDMDYFGSIFNTSSWVSTAGMTTPFQYFDGSGSLSFKHKADHDDGTYLYSQLDVYLISPDGTAINLIPTHYYKFLGVQVNGDPTIVQNVSVSVPEGYYRVEWEWSDASSWTEFYIDDITIDIDTNSFVETENVCFDEVVSHTPSTAVNDGAPYYFEYTWSWVGTPGGTITPQTTNGKTASVDWNVGPGMYRLKVTETYESGSCNGRITYIDVRVLDQPEFELSIDTVCEGFQATLTFDGIKGKSPFTVTYNDGSGVKTLTTSGNDGVATLIANAPDVNIIDVVDDNGCHAASSALITYPVYYHPKPSTGPIYHQ